MAARRSGVLLLVAAACLACWLPGAFVPQPAAARRGEAAVASAAAGAADARAPVDVLALGASAGLLAAQPAHAGILFDEIIPYASVTSFAILWGIVLGFVLLRLQEAFPE